MAAVSKEEYLKRYLCDGEAPAGKKKKKVKVMKTGGMRIVDDDVTWKNLMQVKNEEERECEEEDEAPLVVEFIDERPEIVRRMEEFRSSSKWKILADENESEPPLHTGSALPDAGESARIAKGDNPPLDRKTSDFSPPRRGRHDSPELSPEKRAGERSQHSGSADPSPSRTRQNCDDFSVVSKKSHFSSDSLSGLGSDSDLSPPRKGRNPSPDSNSAAARKRSSVKAGEREGRSAAAPRCRHDSDSDLSPPRKGSGYSSDSDLSPPRRRNAEPDLSPPRRGHITDRRGNSRATSPGGKESRSPASRKVGLLSADVLRQEREEQRLRDTAGEHLADESKNATTVFRDKSGKKRDLRQERIEHRKKQNEMAATAEKYAQWGKGLAQGEQQKRNTEAALHEMQKPLTRHADDEDLERMLRERERDGDPMAGLLRRKKEKEAKNRNEKPRYSGPMPPPNRFNIYPGYRWDGVDRSNGFEQKRYARLADQKAVQDMAYKWSVEDM